MLRPLLPGLLLVTACNSVKVGDPSGGDDGSCTLTATDAATSTTWTYTRDGRLALRVRTDATGEETAEPSYDGDRLVGTVRTPAEGDAVTRTFTWDGDDLVGVSDTTGYTLDLGYDDDGQLEAWTWGNDVASSGGGGSLAWADGFPTDGTAWSDGSTGTISGTFIWDEEGRLARSTWGGVVRLYTLDDDGRLGVLQKTWSGGDVTTEFTYEDGVLTAWSSDSGAGTATYDGDGNVLTFDDGTASEIGGTCERSLQDHAPGEALLDPVLPLVAAEDPLASGEGLCVWCEDALL